MNPTDADELMADEPKKEREFTLYWSRLKSYEHCPQETLWNWGWGDIDVGGGPGKKKPKPYRQSRHHAVMGIVIQAVIERFYNDELWREPDGLAERLEKMTEKEWKYQAQKDRNWVDYRQSGPKRDLLKICKHGVLGFMKTLKEHQFLGASYARAEVDLIGFIPDPDTGKLIPIGGIADTIVQREDTGITILDGKNAKSRGKYLQSDQLRWYALCFYLVFRKMPDRLAFVYYRYPTGTPMMDKDDPILDENGKQRLDPGAEFVPFTKDDLVGLARRAVLVRRGMEAEEFEPTPKPPYCKWCDYETVCPARQAQKAANRAKRKTKKRKGIAALDDIESGFIDI
jgi:hypothetical protein